jgi:hypothetical protein
MTQAEKYFQCGIRIPICGKQGLGGEKKGINVKYLGLQTSSLRERE